MKTQVKNIEQSAGYKISLFLIYATLVAGLIVTAVYFLGGHHHFGAI